MRAWLWKQCMQRYCDMCLLMLCVDTTLAPQMLQSWRKHLREEDTHGLKLRYQLRVSAYKHGFPACRDDSASLIDNLKGVLCVEFPSQPKTAMELVHIRFVMGTAIVCAHTNTFITQDSIECSICYQGNDEGGTPDICCDNCSKYYHKECIVEVLITIRHWCLIIILLPYMGNITNVHMHASGSKVCPLQSTPHFKVSLENVHIATR